MLTHDEQRRAAQQKTRREIAKRWPDAYYVGGVGWCGPDFQSAQAHWDAGEVSRLAAFGGAL